LNHKLKIYSKHIGLFIAIASTDKDIYQLSMLNNIFSRTLSILIGCTNYLQLRLCNIPGSFSTYLKFILNSTVVKLKRLVSSKVNQLLYNFNRLLNLKHLHAPLCISAPLPCRGLLFIHLSLLQPVIHFYIVSLA